MTQYEYVVEYWFINGTFNFMRNFGKMKNENRKFVKEGSHAGRIKNISGITCL